MGWRARGLFTEPQEGTVLYNPQGNPQILQLYHPLLVGMCTLSQTQNSSRSMYDSQVISSSSTSWHVYIPIPWKMWMKMCPGAIYPVLALKTKSTYYFLDTWLAILAKHDLVKVRKCVQVCRLTTVIYKSQEAYAKLLSWCFFVPFLIIFRNVCLS